MIWNRFIRWERELSPSQITVIYAVLLGLWIFASDRVLATLMSDTMSRAQIGVFKDVIFVLVSAALLYGLISRFTDRIRQSEAQLAHADRLASVGTMAASVAHEVNNPLTTIKVLIQTLRDRMTDMSSDRQDLDVVLDEIDNIRALILRLLQFARPNEPQLSEIRLEKVSQRVVNLVRPQAGTRRTEITEHYSTSSDHLWADQSQLGQVILNVLLNAVEAAPEGGQVSVTTTNSDDASVTIQIWNSGESLDRALRERIFEPFYSTKASGTGLGLAIATAIVGKHHGRIWADAGPDGGTAISVQLPRQPKGIVNAPNSGG